jgi:hypothetical protein
MIKNNLNNLITKFIERTNAEFFKSKVGEHCVSLKDGDGFKTFYINTEQFSDYLLHFCHNQGESLNEHQLKQLSLMCRSRSSLSKEKRDTFIRVASKNGNSYIDLGNERLEVIKITPHGWSIITDCNIPFIRPVNQLALPNPVHIGRHEFLEKFNKSFNFKNNDDLLLALAGILKCLIKKDKSSYIMFILMGQKGSGKTTTSHRIKLLIDPSNPPLLGPPRDEKSILVMAKNSHFLAFDNISGMNGDMADFYCRLSSGNGVIEKLLYTNSEAKIYLVHNPVLFNGISEICNRADFLDRTIILETIPLSEKTRIEEEEFEQKFLDDYPRLTGGLYSLLSDCLKVLPNEKSENLQRMTAYHKLGNALEKVLGLPKKTFTNAYVQARNDSTEDIFWDDEVCCRIYEVLHKQRKLFKLRYPEPKTTVQKNVLAGILLQRSLVGTPLSILNTLSKVDRRDSSRKISLPKNAQTFSRYLKRIEPVLNSKDIIIQRSRTSDERTIRISFSTDSPYYLTDADENNPDSLSPADSRIAKIEAGWTADSKIAREKMEPLSSTEVSKIKSETNYDDYL